MSGPPFTILIVDHEPRNRRVLGAMLHRTGYRTRVAASGAEALSSIARNVPDLIVLDTKIAGTCGYAVADGLKGDPETARIPIILVGRHCDERPAGPPARAQEFMDRPFDRAELSLRVRGLIFRRAGGVDAIALS